MVDVVSAVLVGSVVIYLMYQNISKITSNIDKSIKGTFETYAAYSSKIQEYIRTVKNDIDSDHDVENPIFILKESTKSKALTKQLADLIRKLVFFETLLAKKKSAEEVEESMFAILDEFDKLVREECVDGETLADQIRDKLYQDYINTQN